MRADDQTPANRSRTVQPLGRKAARRAGYCTRCKQPFQPGQYATPDKQWRSVSLMYRHTPSKGGCP